MTDSQCLSYLRDISKTPQDEEIERMLTFYEVQGVIDVTSKQIQLFVKRIMKERKIMNNATENTTFVPQIIQQEEIL